MKVVCINCPEGAPEIDEEEYAQHMSLKHPSGQLGTLANKKNVPKSPSNLPPGINPSDLPDPTFLETVKMIEQESQKPPTSQSSKPQDSTVKVSPPSSTPVAETKPITLTYKYEGSCPTCNTPVNTIMVDLKGSLHAIAFCLTHKQLSEMEVWKIGSEEKYPKKEGKR